MEEDLRSMGKLPIRKDNQGAKPAGKSAVKVSNKRL